jgi:hypothetical protein
LSFQYKKPAGSYQRAFYTPRTCSSRLLVLIPFTSFFADVLTQSVGFTVSFLGFFIGPITYRRIAGGSTGPSDNHCKRAAPDAEPISGVPAG